MGGSSVAPASSALRLAPPVSAPSVPLKPAGKASTSKGIATFTMDDAEDDEDGPKKGKGKGKAAKEAKPKADKKAAGMASMMSFFGKK